MSLHHQQMSYLRKPSLQKIKEPGSPFNKISGECGGVQISFPRNNKEKEGAEEGAEPKEVSEQVKVKGPENCVDAALKMIQEEVENFIAQVTESIEIEKVHHREIIGKGGKQVQEVSKIQCFA